MEEFESFFEHPLQQWWATSRYERDLGFSPVTYRDLEYWCEPWPFSPEALETTCGNGHLADGSLQFCTECGISMTTSDALPSETKEL